MNKKEIESTLNNLLTTLEQNFKYSYGKKIPFDDVFKLMKDTETILNLYTNVDTFKCSDESKKRFIPLLRLLIAVDSDYEHLIEYQAMLKNAYKLSARHDFESFLIYYEWDNKEKLYETRIKILQPYAYYLNKMVFDKTFETLIVNLPSGYGKSRLVRLYEAFTYGIKPHATFLALCSNDDLIRGQSRSVIDIIKSEKFGEVFPKMKYDKNRDRDYFLKSTDAEWRLFTCKSISSYYAKSTQSNVVGVRVNDASVDIDDLYSDFQEALNPTLNKYYFNKFITVWRERHNTNETYKSVITGTLWSSGDFIDLAIQWLEGRSKFKKHPKFDFTRISEDGKSAIIQVPALDYETGESTCPEIISTKDLLIKKNSIDPYLWSTNYQQLPQNPDMMEFSYEKLKTYDVMPEMADKYTKAVIDGTRKGGDFFSMPIFQPYGEDWALIDCIFTKQATSELIDEIVGKIIEHHIIYLVVESNVDGGLKKILDEKLQLKGITWCIIVEKYNTVQKKIRIEVNKGTTLRRIYFPKKEMFGTNTEMGKFMESFTLYNSDGRNAHDDANDSTAMFSSEIIEENSKPQKAEVLDFVRRYM